MHGAPSGTSHGDQARAGAACPCSSAREGGDGGGGGARPRLGRPRGGRCRRAPSTAGGDGQRQETPGAAGEPRGWGGHGGRGSSAASPRCLADRERTAGGPRGGGGGGRVQEPSVFADRLFWGLSPTIQAPVGSMRPGLAAPLGFGSSAVWWWR